MADMTSLISPSTRIPHQFQTAIEHRVIDLNFGDSALSGMLAAATHNIMSMAAGETIVYGRGIVHTTCTSTSNNGTFVLSCGDALHAALTADGTEMAAGDVFGFAQQDMEDAAGIACYRAAADTLDFTIGTNAFTAGRIILIVGIFNVASWTDNG